MILLNLNPEKDIMGKKIISKRTVFENNELSRSHQRCFPFPFVLLVMQHLFFPDCSFIVLKKWGMLILFDC